MARYRQDFLTDYSNQALIDELRRVARSAPDGALTQAVFRQLGRVSASAVRKRFGSWKAALSAAGLDNLYSGKNVTEKMKSQHARGLSNEELLAQMRDVAGSLGKCSLTALEFNEGSNISSSTIRARFGSWGKALHAAGLESSISVKQRKIRERYLQVLSDAARSHGKNSISQREFDKFTDQTSSQAISQFFGSWEHALAEAGLERSKPTPRSKEQCLRNLLSLWKSKGRQPRYNELSKHPSRIGPKAYERIWGTYSAALREFVTWAADKKGLIIDSRTLTRSMTNEEMIQELLRVSRLVGRNEVTQEDVEAHSHIHPRTFAVRLGSSSWRKALEAAGLGLSKHGRRYTEDEFFRNLIAVWEFYGRRPRYAEMNRSPSTITAEGYAARFGTWRKALLSFLQWAESSEEESMVDQERSNADIDSSDKTVPISKRDKRRTLSDKERFLVFKRDNFRCVVCGASPATQLGVQLVPDHIVAWANGGKTSVDNSQTLCIPCNQGKGGTG